MMKKFFQQGRSKRKLEAYVFQYVEGLSVASTQLEGYCSIRQLL